MIHKFKMEIRPSSNKLCFGCVTGYKESFSVRESPSACLRVYASMIMNSIVMLCFADSCPSTLEGGSFIPGSHGQY